MSDKDFAQHSKYKFLYQKKASGIYYLVKTIDGIRYKKSTRQTKLEAAKREAETMEKQIRKLQSGGDYYQKIRESTGVTDPLIKDLWDDFLKFKFIRISKSTQQTYEGAETHIFEFWGNKTLSQFTPSEVEKWEAWFIKNRSHMVYFNIRKNLVVFANWLKKKNLVKDHIDFENLDKTVLNRINKREVHGKTYTQAEVKGLLSSTCSTCALPVAIALTMGARKSEILKLKRESVFVSEDGILVVKFWSFKNKKFREVPVSDCVKAGLLAQVKKIDGEYLFPAHRKQGEPISSQVLDKSFNKLKVEIGLTERKTFHDLRRTFATMTAENGWPPVVACRILDMSLNMYDKVYTKPSQHSLKKFIELVDIDKYSLDATEIKGGADD